LDVATVEQLCMKFQDMPTVTHRAKSQHPASRMARCRKLRRTMFSFSS
jgi:hypothetical protein